jgi:hypothetical protein
VRDSGKMCEQQRYRENPGSWPAATSAKVARTDGTLGLGAGMNLDRNSDLHRVRETEAKCEQHMCRDSLQSRPAATSAKPSEGTLGLGAGMNSNRNSDLQRVRDRRKKCEKQRYRGKMMQPACCHFS